MGALDTLFNAAPPQNVTTSQTSATAPPDWYQQFTQGLAAKSAQVGQRGYIPFGGARVQGFSPDQSAAFQGVRDAQGNWQPTLQNATGAAAGATGAVAGPAQNWTDNWQQYMSPFTSSVVNEIGRLGNQNLNENILHGVNDSFIGSGGFGSTRNAEMIGRGIRDAQTNISGLQSSALQQGYGTSANIFNTDANRVQQQGALQAQTGLGAASQLGALSQVGQNLGYNDLSKLGSVGQMQQDLGQKQLDVNYGDFTGARDFDMNQLNSMKGLISGIQLPQTTTQSSSQPYGNVGTSPAQYLNSLIGLSGANGQNTNGSGALQQLLQYLQQQGTTP